MNGIKNKKIILATVPQAYSIEKWNAAPLGLAYIASCLEKEGYDVEIVDSHLNNFSINKTTEVIMDKDPIAVGITSSTINRFNVIELSGKIKKLNPSTMVFVGGPHFSTTAEDAIQNIPAIDFVVIGEGEVTVVELLNSYFSNKQFHNVKGICFRDNDNRIVKTEERPVINNLDSLPMPAYHLLELKKYDPLPYYLTNLTIKEKKIPAVGVISTRGCPYNCIFCANKAEGVNSTVRKRSPKNFVDEIQYLYEKHGFRMFNLWNDTFTISKQYVYDICNEIIKRTLKIKWYARGRVNSVDKEMLNKMKEAGCVAIMYGAESGSDKILEIINKNITTEQIRKAVKESADVGLDVLVSFMVSSPQETIEDVNKTLDLVKELRSYSNKIFEMDLFPTLIYPGTSIERIALSEGKINTKYFSWNKMIEFKENKQLLINPYIPIYTQKFTLEEIMTFRLKNKFQQQFKQSKVKLLLKGIRLIINTRSFKNLKSILNFLLQYSKKTQSYLKN